MNLVLMTVKWRANDGLEGRLMGCISEKGSFFDRNLYQIS